MTLRQIACFTVAATLVCTTRIGAQQSPTAPARTTYDDMKMFSQVLNQIRVNHVDSVQANALMLAAVEGMIRATDPHSYLLPASRAPAGRELDLLQGRVVQVPLVFAFVGETAFLISVAPGTSAARVDLLPGDELAAADGKPIVARSAEELNLALAGPRDSEIKLSFNRTLGDGTTIKIERKVRRQRPEEAEAVPVAAMLDAHTAYIRIVTFANPRTSVDFAAALKRVADKGMDRLVLDLRDNGGGLVAQAGIVAASLLGPGTVIAVNQYRRHAPDTLRADTASTKLTFRQPLVVLVNAGTASASEMLAGALQDHDRAVIVGRPTFGKALILQPFPLTDGSVMWLTVGKTRTPCGRIIQREYRNQSTREYVRAATSEHDTTASPRCTSDGGRTLLGGGGITPDVVTRPDLQTPRWISALFTDESVLQWLGQFLQRQGSLFTKTADLEDTKKLDVAVSDLREFATRRKLEVPSDTATTAPLRTLARNAIAWTKFGPGEFYRMTAQTDPDVTAGIAAFADVSRLPPPKR